MPLVALVQKKTQRTRNFVLSSGARRSLPRRRCSSRSVFEQVSACIRTLKISKLQTKKALIRVPFIIIKILFLVCGGFFCRGVKDVFCRGFCVFNHFCCFIGRGFFCCRGFLVLFDAHDDKLVHEEHNNKADD